MATLAFTTPWLLLGLLALPLLWWLLRALPPAPRQRRFPGVMLLIGLKDAESESDRTPWWLLVLRSLAMAAAIIGFAGPVLNPEAASRDSGPLLVVMDASWASAADWEARRGRVADLLGKARRAGRPVALVALTDPPAGAPDFQAANAVAQRLAGLAPQPFAPDPEAVARWSAGLGRAQFETVWLSDGLARKGRAALTRALRRHGGVRVIESGQGAVALTPAVFAGGRIDLGAVRSRAGTAASYTLVARGPDPAGIPRVLARARLSFSPGARTAKARFSLPLELRNRIRRFEISGLGSAGAVVLTDDALQRRKVALVAGEAPREGQDLLSPLYYLKRALAPSAELIEGPLAVSLKASPDVVILADVARLSATESAALREWVKAGGLLLRFAGPRLAASDLARMKPDPLLPVRLRAGGRSVGGALSWGAPKRLRAFATDSPFHGLSIPDDVTVSTQVMAQPDPELSARVIATLADGTPLVTRKALGEGEVVLFHVTANAEWSSLPLSGLFVEMLARLAVARRPTALRAQDLAGTTWVARSKLDGFGLLGKAGRFAGVAGERLVTGAPARDMPPGLYASGKQSIALNVLRAGQTLAPARWPSGVHIEGLARATPRAFAAPFLLAALLLLLADILATLALSGRLVGAWTGVAGLALALMLPLPQAHAQGAGDDARALLATKNVVLAYVKTGDASLDRISEAGLAGLSRTLARRTSVEPGPPIGVDLERDELAFFPLLYWPVSAAQARPSPAAYGRLNRYLRHGGTIVFDTRDADLGGSGETPGQRRLRALLLPLDIPALEPVPRDHVLTRAFYLLRDFPGRFAGAPVWVEAAPAGVTRTPGVPFRNLNDGVSPVLIGGNDWAAAWATDSAGRAMFPVGRGLAGERQREMARRFGVNLVMYVLTGNYKSDQVHVPALLERLGQ